MKPILALDVSKNGCGFAFGIPGDKPVSGVERLAGSSDDHAFRNGIVWLSTIIGTMKPEVVAIEAPIKSSGGGFTNADSQAMLLGLQGALRGVVYARLGYGAVLVPSQSARKSFTGKGVYAKGEAKAAVQAEVLRRGWLSIEDMQPDRADALCLWGHMASLQDRSIAFTRRAA